jgi:hypothetical protein
VAAIAIRRRISQRRGPRRLEAMRRSKTSVHVAHTMNCQRGAVRLRRQHPRSLDAPARRGLQDFGNGTGCAITSLYLKVVGSTVVPTLRIVHRTSLVMPCVRKTLGFAAGSRHLVFSKTTHRETLTTYCSKMVLRVSWLCGSGYGRLAKATINHHYHRRCLSRWCRIIPNQVEPNQIGM